ncbi:MAG: gluconate 5-dehydrogenase [bacterium]
MSLKLFDLSDKNALLTGATHGLGMAMAKGLGDAGANLIINGHSPERMEKALKDYKDYGLDVHSYLFDVTQEKEVAENVSKIEKEAGPVDILVNNAAIIKRIPLAEMDVEDYKEVIDVDLIAPFIMAKHIVRGMIKRRKGKIINICSMMSEMGRDTVGAYAAAKGGLKMLTRSMATEWARYNIQVNAIGPGYFATEQTAPIREKGNPIHEFIKNRTPAGVWGNPEQLAGSAIFLASEASDFVNGHILYVDGGILATIGKPMDSQ